ncbi:MAG TPA: hypothetical protein V6C52_14195 [Coleofasciculaceae cyanobacterium]|jgi:hypothetical protein
MVSTRFTANKYRELIAPTFQAPKGAVTFGKAATPSWGAASDVFIKKSAPADTARTALQANRLMTLLRDEINQEKRRTNAVAFFHALTGQPPMFHKTPQVEEARRVELETIAKTVREMPPAQKLELIRQTTGPASPYSRVAEALLVNQEMPTMKDVMRCVAPGKNDITPASTGAQTAAFGLLMLSSVLMPAAAIMRPDLAAQAVAAAATAVL